MFAPVLILSLLTLFVAADSNPQNER